MTNANEPDFYALQPDTDLYRVYRRTINEAPAGPAWFCDGTQAICRFDPIDSGATCYTADTPGGAFMETILRISTLGIRRKDIDQRNLAVMHAVSELKLIDLTDPTNFGRLGVDARLAYELEEGYRRCRAFAQQMIGIGMNGVRYRSPRDPEGTRRNLAVFADKAGDHSDVILSIESTGPIPEPLTESLLAAFGIAELDGSDRYPVKAA